MPENLFKLPRLTLWIVTSIVLMAFLGLIEPQQLTVLVYKLLLVSAAAVMGYWLDRSLFPYARPHVLVNLPAPDDCCECARNMRLTAGLAMLRRALVILAVVIGVALGL